MVLSTDATVLLLLLLLPAAGTMYVQEDNTPGVMPWPQYNQCTGTTPGVVFVADRSPVPK